MILPLTCPDVAEILGVTRQCVAVWASEGVLPGQKTTGGMWLFDPAIVAAFVPPNQRTRRVGCAVQDCDSTHHSLGYCKPHYQRLMRTGDVRSDVPVGEGIHVVARTRSQVDLVDTEEL